MPTSSVIPAPFGQINGAASLGLVGNTLYVVNNFADTITAYDATTEEHAIGSRP